MLCIYTRVLLITTLCAATIIHHITSTTHQFAQATKLLRASESKAPDTTDCLESASFSPLESSDVVSEEADESEFSSDDDSDSDELDSDELDSTTAAEGEGSGPPNILTATESIWRATLHSSPEKLATVDPTAAMLVDASARTMETGKPPLWRHMNMTTLRVISPDGTVSEGNGATLADVISGGNGGGNISAFDGMPITDKTDPAHLTVTTVGSAAKNECKMNLVGRGLARNSYEKYDDSLYLCRYGHYLTAFGTKTKTPDWSAYFVSKHEVITKDTILEKNKKRFRDDVSIGQDLPVQNGCYSEFMSRGHLCPANIMRFDTKRGGAYLSTYVITNTAMQTQGFNSGIWSTLEQHILEWLKSRTDFSDNNGIYIVTGTLFKDRENPTKSSAVCNVEDGNLYAAWGKGSAPKEVDLLTEIDTTIGTHPFVEEEVFFSPRSEEFKFSGRVKSAGEEEFHTPRGEDTEEHVKAIVDAFEEFATPREGESTGKTRKFFEDESTGTTIEKKETSIESASTSETGALFEVLNSAPVNPGEELTFGDIKAAAGFDAQNPFEIVDAAAQVRLVNAAASEAFSVAAASPTARDLKKFEQKKEKMLSGSGQRLSSKLCASRGGSAGTRGAQRSSSFFPSKSIKTVNIEELPYSYMRKTPTGRWRIYLRPVAMSEEDNSFHFSYDGVDYRFEAIFKAKKKKSKKAKWLQEKEERKKMQNWPKHKLLWAPEDVTEETVKRFPKSAFYFPEGLYTVAEGMYDEKLEQEIIETSKRELKKDLERKKYDVQYFDIKNLEKSDYANLMAVPDYFYKIVCDPKNNKSIAFIGHNAPELYRFGPKLGPKLMFTSVAELQKILKLNLIPRDPGFSDLISNPCDIDNAAVSHFWDSRTSSQRGGFFEPPSRRLKTLNYWDGAPYKAIGARDVNGERGNLRRWPGHFEEIDRVTGQIGDSSTGDRVSTEDSKDTKDSNTSDTKGTEDRVSTSNKGRASPPRNDWGTEKSRRGHFGFDAPGEMEAEDVEDSTRGNKTELVTHKATDTDEEADAEDATRTATSNPTITTKPGTMKPGTIKPGAYSPRPDSELSLKSCAHLTTKQSKHKICNNYVPKNPCQCNNKCEKFRNCCSDVMPICRGNKRLRWSNTIDGRFNAARAEKAGDTVLSLIVT